MKKLSHQMLILSIIIVAFGIIFAMMISAETNTYHQGEEIYLSTPEQDACLHCHIAGSAPNPQVPNNRWISFGGAGIIFFFGITRNLSIWKTRDAEWQHRWMRPLSRIIAVLFLTQIIVGGILIFFANPMPEALLNTPVSFDYIIRAIHWGSAILLFVSTLIFSFVGSQTSEDQRLFWGSLFLLEVFGGIYAMSQLSLAYLRADWVINLDPSRLYTLHLFLLPAMIIGILGLYLTKLEKSND
ncbi:MAG: hypothetical protein HN392_07840 [Anaerolineae bacterium]|jgi:hypothetical protein|nr:hypothetical protein [Anaerolineae bacterium]MBT7074581.1 hypothetical protein [Anaerolineae bacterium]MBT7783338.1 hypothetical protein [Anaerolineae bacterium]